MTAAAAPAGGVEDSGPDGSGPEGSGSGPAEASLGQRLKAVAERLLVTLIDKAAAAAADQVDDLIGTLDEIAAQGGPRLQAVIAAGKAMLSGDNPVWAAIKTGIGSLSTGMKVLLVIVTVLAMLLAPVLLVILLLAAIVAAIVAAIRAAAG